MVQQLVQITTKLCLKHVWVPLETLPWKCHGKRESWSRSLIVMTIQFFLQLCHRYLLNILRYHLEQLTNRQGKAVQQMCLRPKAWWEVTLLCHFIHLLWRFCQIGIFLRKTLCFGTRLFRSGYKSLRCWVFQERLVSLCLQNKHMVRLELRVMLWETHWGSNHLELQLNGHRHCCATLHGYKRSQQNGNLGTVLGAWNI